MIGLKKEIEDYVGDWHRDNESKKYAFDLGKFIFSFIELLIKSGVYEMYVNKIEKELKNN